MKKLIRVVLSNNYAPIFLIITISTIIKFVYVFYCTAYQDYLVTDMGGYWFRAVERFEGNEFSINQWVIWPTFYHFFLSFVFRILNLLQLYTYKLQIVLSLNIAFSSLSVFFLYLITQQIANSRKISLVIAGLYAFAYPFIYFNAFILSENFSIPLVIIAIWFLFKSDKIPDMLYSGILLGLAVAARPSYGLLGIPFFVYILSANSQIKIPFTREMIKPLKKGFVRGLIFSFAFFLVLGCVIAENGRISKGKLKGLSANGGINFYLAVTQIHKITSNFYGYTYILVPPATVEYPDNGSVTTDVPIYDQDHFFQLGMEYIKNNPSALIDKVKQFPTLFFGPLMPSMGSALWFNPLINISRLIFFIMFIALGLVPIVFKNKNINISRLTFICSIPLLSLITYSIFSIEHRYLYSFAFAICILFVLIIYQLITDFKAHTKYFIRYVFAIIAFFLFLWACNFYKIKTMPKIIKAAIAQDKNGVESIDQRRATLFSETVFINNISFRKAPFLKHSTLGLIGFKENFFVDFSGEFEVMNAQTYAFSIFSDDGFRLIIDGKEIAAYTGLRPFEESMGYVYLDKGKHLLQLSYFQHLWDTGIVAYYRCENLHNKSKVNRFLIGNDSFCLKFSTQQ